MMYCLKCHYKLIVKDISLEKRKREMVVGLTVVDQMFCPMSAVETKMEDLVSQLGQTKVNHNNGTLDRSSWKLIETKLMCFDTLYPFPVKVYFVNLYNHFSQLNKVIQTESVSSITPITMVSISWSKFEPTTLRI